MRNANPYEALRGSNHVSNFAKRKIAFTLLLFALWPLMTLLGWLLGDRNELFRHLSTWTLAHYVLQSQAGILIGLTLLTHMFGILGYIRGRIPITLSLVSSICSGLLTWLIAFAINSV